MLGQDKLLNRINNLNLDTFPQSLLLIGAEGCGKHTLLNYIADHLSLDLVELDNKVDEEIISKILDKPYPLIYYIDVDKALPKLQNNILKLIEEPQMGKYYILLSKSTNNILPTLLNRCKVWYFEAYNKEILSNFVNIEDKNLILNIASTPGQVINMQNHPLKEMDELASNIIERVHLVSLSNLLTISDKIAFKDEKDKFNLDIFLRVLSLNIKNKIIINPNNTLYKLYAEVINVINELNFTISKQKTFENFLLRFQEVSNL